MATLPAQTNFDGVADETTLTAANSGGSSGQDFDTVVIAGAATMVVDTAQVPAGTSRAVRLTNNTAVTASIGRWASGSAESRIGGRISLYLPSIHTTSWYPILMSDNSGNARGQIGITAGGKFSILDSTFTLVATSTANVPTNQWFRIEWNFDYSSSPNANPQVRLYLASEGTATIAETMSPTNVNLGGTTAQRAAYGIAGNATTGLPQFWWTNPQINNTGFPGAAVPDSTARAVNMMMGL